VNRGVAPATARFSPPSDWSGGRPEEVWAGSSVRVLPESVEIEVPPTEARIVTRRRPGDPEPMAK
jgi:hypothetical protein